MSFEGLGFLLLPADPGLKGVIKRVDDRWRLPVEPDARNAVMVWGREPLRSGTRPVTAARSALARERALRSVRGRGGASFRVTGIHRLHPPVLAGGRVRNRVRAALLEGAIVELWSQGDVRRVIDAVAAEALGSGRVTRLRSGSGGSALVRLPRVAGPEALLRAARLNDPADPRRSAEALEALEPLQLKQIPRLLGRGQVAGASWIVESLLPGHRPPRLPAAVAHEVVVVLARLPGSERPATAHDEDHASLSAAFPRWAAILAQLADEQTEVARAVPSVFRHGDLWAGNLLVRRHRLTGIVDWDAWHPAGLPGVDLLHLLASGLAIRGKAGVGSTWLGRPWESEEYRSAAADYWKAMRIAPNARFLRAVGIAWWAGHVAASIRRLPHLAGDDRWVASNVNRVLVALGGSA